MKKFLGIFAMLVCGLGFFPSCDLFDNDDDDDGVGLIADCDVKKSVRDDYKDDAARLALRFQLESGPAANDILISSALVDRFLAGISAVYKSDFAARDTVFDIYDIHTIDSPEFSELRIQVDTTVAWVKEWESGKRLTGNSDIDALMNFYGLDLDEFDSFELEENQVLFFAFIKATDPVNINSLAQRFEGIEGVIATKVDASTADGNDIMIVDNGTTLDITFTVGYDKDGDANDCTGDCEFRRGWIFQVDDDCDVKFVNSFGDSAP